MKATAPGVSIEVERPTPRWGQYETFIMLTTHSELAWRATIEEMEQFAEELQAVIAEARRVKEKRE
jgi:hypothetical protein